MFITPFKKNKIKLLYIPSRFRTGESFLGEIPGALTITQGLWACDSSGDAVRLVSLESVCWKDEFPDDMELESCAPATDPAVTVKKQNQIKRVNLSSNKHGNTEGLMSKSDK